MRAAVTLCSATLGEDGCTEPPLGPLYVSAAFERAGFEVDFRDYQLAADADVASGGRLERFLAGHADILAISCFVDMLPAVVDATRGLHRRRPDTTIVLGGPGPSAHARELVETYPWISAVVRGEADETIADFAGVLRGAGGRPVPGMAYRWGDEIIDGPPRGRLRDLDSLPLPAYHLIRDWSRYSAARIITTRGCSYRCTFCDVTFLWGARSTFRSIDHTVAEMELLRDRYGRAAVAIVDDTFVLNRDRVTRLCQRLIERGGGFTWGCFGRINLMTRELIALMARAGCQAVFYGIDSGSPALLRRIAKHIRPEDVLPTLRWSAECFDKVEASFIWGYPFETLDDFRRTLDMAAQASLLAGRVNVQLHLLSPLPSSPIYHEFHAHLREPDEADRPWLLLPPLLLDRRARALARIVRAHPALYPGFFSFETPDVVAKRALLGRAMRRLDRFIGASVYEPKVRRLRETDDPRLERRLVAAERHPADRIGVGLGVSFLRRARNRQGFVEGRRPFEGTRGPAMVRSRG